MCLLINLLTLFSSYMQSNDLGAVFLTSLHCGGESFTGHCLVIHNGQRCKCKTGSSGNELDWDQHSQGCQLKNLSLIPHVLSSASLLVYWLPSTRTEQASGANVCLWWNWWNDCGFVSMAEKTFQTKPPRALRFSVDILLAPVEVSSRYKFHFRSKVMFISWNPDELHYP